MNKEDAIRMSRELLEPYRIPEDCPYLSEDQKELSLLSLEKRGQWFAEWLLLSTAYDEYLSEDESIESG